MKDETVFCPRTNCKHNLRGLANKGGVVAGWSWACECKGLVMRLNERGQAMCDSFIPESPPREVTVTGLITLDDKEGGE